MIDSSTMDADSNPQLRAGCRPRYLIVLNEIGFLYSHFWVLATAIQKAGWDVI